MIRNCTCMGTNEKCERCSGKGYYDDSPPPPMPPPRPIARGTANASTSTQSSDGPDSENDRHFPTPVKVYVGNLSYRTTHETIRNTFAAFGEVRQVLIPTDRRSDQSRGFAFVTMGSAQAAKEAISQLNGRKLDGRPLCINEARERPQARNKVENQTKARKKSAKRPQDRKPKSQVPNRSNILSRASEMNVEPAPTNSPITNIRIFLIGDDSHDKTRLTGFPSRDHGKFGSYPLHDGFDDESGPE